MSKKAFVRNASVSFMTYPDVLAAKNDCRVDMAIDYAEALWLRLSARGYGEKVEGEPTACRQYIEELKDRDKFERCRKAYGDKGDRQAAAKAWLKVQEHEKQMLELAIPLYIKDIKETGTAKAHMSTWLNQERWMSYTDAVVERKDKQLSDIELEIREHLGAIQQFKKFGQEQLVEAAEQRVEELRKKLAEEA